MAKTSTFFSGIGAANIVDGYDLNGAKHGSSARERAPDAATAVGLLPGPCGRRGDEQRDLPDASSTTTYARLATGQMLVGGAYYDESWG